MRNLIIAAAIAASPVLSWAACSTHTYFVNGKVVTCTTCCYGASCNTNCF